MKIEPDINAPVILNLAATQRVYQNVEVDDETEPDGEPAVMKFRATKEFIAALNGVTYELLAQSIQNALEDDRSFIRPEDLPKVETYEKEDMCFGLGNQESLS